MSCALRWRRRLGVVGFSAGGYTALLAAGARPDLQRLLAFCRAHPDDGVCRPQQEAATHTMEARLAAATSPALAPWISHSDDARALPGVRAVFLLAPAIVQAFAPGQLSSLQLPVSIVLGDADKVAPPTSNGEAAQALIPAATGPVHRCDVNGGNPPADGGCSDGVLRRCAA
ncbi:hypothetical protein G6F31_018406 [Rhizopus arrhizus]|nr:hypothetical protein G6F31_018406 [Rhizopus arrhizus]